MEGSQLSGVGEAAFDGPTVSVKLFDHISDARNIYKFDTWETLPMWSVAG